MRRQIRTATVLLTICCLAAAAAGAELSDPYEILEKHYAAMGGLEEFKAQQTSHVEGTIVLEGTGLAGTFVEWREMPIRNRQEVDLTVITQITGDNGEFRWVVDHNGKLQINRDDVTLKERRVQKLLAEYDHLNRDSEYFTLTFAGTETVGGRACYLVEIANSINDDITIQYFDKDSFLLIKSEEEKPDSETHTLYSDYREVGGILVAFSQSMTQLPTGMQQTITLTTVEIDVPVDVSLFDPPGEDEQDFSFADGRSAENIPFQFIENHIYLPVTVAGKTRLWVLDSGAGATVIEEEFATELGLETQGELKGLGAGNLVDFSFTDLPAFDLDGVHFNEQKAAVVKLNWLFQKWIGQDIAGILGYDFLSRLVIKIDYANEMISLYHPDSFTYAGDGTILEAPISRNNMFHVPLTVDGKHGGLWNLDLGAGGMSFHYPYAEEHGILDLTGFDGVGFGAGGSQKTSLAQFDLIEFAGFVEENPIISWPTEGGAGAFASKDLTGNIGNTLLRHFVLYLDYKREQVIVEKGDNYDHTFPRDNSGIQVMISENGDFEVLSVSPDTPGAKAGFRAGDVIHSINDIDVEYLGGIVAVREILRREPGTEFTIGIIRDGKEKTLKLTLRDLFK